MNNGLKTLNFHHVTNGEFSLVTMFVADIKRCSKEEFVIGDYARILFKSILEYYVETL